MKIVSENKRTKVELKNKDEVEISTYDGKVKMHVKCLGKTLHVEDSFETIEDKTEEENAIKAMNKYLKKKKSNKEKSKKAKEIKKSS